MAALAAEPVRTVAAMKSLAIVATSEPPTSVATSRDGKWLFVGLDHHFSDPGGIVAYRLRADHAERAGGVTVTEGVRGIALAPDGRALAYTTRSGPGIIAVDALTADGHIKTVANERDGDVPGSDQIVFSHDGRYVFYSNQRAASLGVAQVVQSETAVRSLHVRQRVNLDRLPGGIALSPDGARLYVTSEIDTSDPATVPGAADSHLGRTSCEVNHGPNGVLSVIDAERAVDDPLHALRARIAAGCAPGRVALSPRGDVAWVSVRGEDRALAFATAKLDADPTHALLAENPSGPEPIGILASKDGTRIFVVASDGEAGRRRPRRSSVTVFDAVDAQRNGAAPLETIDAGVRPRELYQSADGTIWITDYAGRAVLIVSDRTPSAAIQRSRCSTYSGPNVSSKQRRYAA